MSFNAPYCPNAGAVDADGAIVSAAFSAPPPDEGGGDGSTRDGSYPWPLGSRAAVAAGRRNKAAYARRHGLAAYLLHAAALERRIARRIEKRSEPARVATVAGFAKATVLRRCLEVHRWCAWLDAEVVVTSVSRPLIPPRLAGGDRSFSPGGLLSSDAGARRPPADLIVAGGVGGFGGGLRLASTSVIVVRRSRWTTNMLAEWWSRRWTPCGRERRREGVEKEGGRQTHPAGCERRALEEMLLEGWGVAVSKEDVEADVEADETSRITSAGRPFRIAEGSVMYAASFELSVSARDWREGDFAARFVVDDPVACRHFGASPGTTSSNDVAPAECLRRFVDACDAAVARAEEERIAAESTEEAASRSDESSTAAALTAWAPVAEAFRAAALKASTFLGKVSKTVPRSKGAKDEPTGTTPPERPSYDALIASDPKAATAAMRAEWRALLRRLPRTPPEKTFRGRGVVIHGGGVQHAASTLIVARIVRSKPIGCTLPIEYWHRGDAPPTPALTAAFLRLGVVSRDVDAGFAAGYIAAGAELLPDASSSSSSSSGGGVPGGVPRLASWAVKPVAVLLSAFEEVVALDADVIPLVDPAEMFEADPYVRGAALFWDDLSWDATEEGSTAMAVAGLLEGRPGSSESSSSSGKVGSGRVGGASSLPGYLRRSLESGQMVVHKGRHWRQLCLAAYFNVVRADYFWNERLGFYGDKDTFRVAWMAAGTPYALPPRHVGLVGYTSGGAFNGHAMLQAHHGSGAPAFLHRNQRKWDPRVLSRYPPAGWNRSRTLTASKGCTPAGTELTDADVPPDACAVAFTTPAALSDMPAARVVPALEVFPFDIEAATWEAMTAARSEPAWEAYAAEARRRGDDGRVYAIDTATVDDAASSETSASTAAVSTRTAENACDGASISSHPSDARRTARDAEAGRTPPALTVVFVTKRPGGYDVLLNSLGAQTSRDYELVCVDELASRRGDAVRAAAAAADVPLARVVTGKPKSDPRRRFGIANAINTGVLLARGKYVTILMDNSWVPADFVERTLAFYADPARAKSFLAYPEHFYHVNDASHFPENLRDPTALSAWGDGRTVSRPLSEDPERFSPGFKRPDYLVDALSSWRRREAGGRFWNGWFGRWRSSGRGGFLKQPLRDGGTFWEMSFATSPRSAWEALNGVEEWLDIGDDCHEANMWMRAEMIGYDVWIDAGVVVENVWHQYGAFEESHLWRRYAKDSNLGAFRASMDKIKQGWRPLASDNSFDMAAWFEHRCVERLPVTAG